jgi:WD40 repeat protein
MLRMIIKIRLILVILATLVLFTRRLTQAQNSAYIWSVAWNPNGNKFALGYTDGQINIIDALEGITTKTYQIYTESADSLAWRDDSVLVAGGVGYGLTIINVDTNAITRIPLSEFSIPVIVPGLTEDQVITGTSGESFLKGLAIWDTTTLTRLAGNTEAGGLFSLSRSHNKMLLATGNTRGSINLHSTQNLQLLARSTPLPLELGALNYPTSVAWSGNDQFIVSGHLDGNLRMWEVSQQNSTYSLQMLWIATSGVGLERNGDATWVKSLVFSPNGKEVSAVNAAGEISVWNAQSGALLSVTRTGNPVISAGFSPDGTKLIMAGEFSGYSIVPIAYTLSNTPTPLPLLPLPPPPL